ncbi:MAG: hypothetical protein AMK71_06375 [Nitrospira bacterium SG8_35_4]|nr:MAG: hypothetical protein AMK71_06375 [Nitrospira bacterium SG8_35_4]
MTVDISHSGAGIWTDYAIKPGTVLHFKNNEIQNKGIVKWRKPNDDNMTYRAGVKFIRGLSIELVPFQWSHYNPYFFN